MFLSLSVSISYSL